MVIVRRSSSAFQAWWIGERPIPNTSWPRQILVRLLSICILTELCDLFGSCLQPIQLSGMHLICEIKKASEPEALTIQWQSARKILSNEPYQSSRTEFASCATGDCASRLGQIWSHFKFWSSKQQNKQSSTGHRKIREIKIKFEEIIFWILKVKGKSSILSLQRALSCKQCRW